MTGDPAITELKEMLIVIEADHALDHSTGTFVIRANHESEIVILGVDEYQHIEKGKEMKGSVSSGQRLAHMTSLMAAAIGLGFGGGYASRVIENPYGRNRKPSATIKNRAGASRNREARRAIYKDRSAYQIVVNGLTNYERNQWARAGYPGQSTQDIKKVAAYSAAVRRAKWE